MNVLNIISKEAHLKYIIEMMVIVNQKRRRQNTKRKIWQANNWK